MTSLERGLAMFCLTIWATFASMVSQMNSRWFSAFYFFGPSGSK